ncbi:hypothetical protein I7I50_06372 [Histoplasma capsulatum G186AR]|uniref:Uncharacterized protein n=1 Tax=Ajellomyces capsulatus TaxID=5037 RepID=A0A8H7YWV6_AJECA|nr:hypothetical protein I7I52_10555 [Histoplasma capsulatum]QSS67331.1 hypothetical protein I7I50_06372 [Histoplasma capsulatum G186AR]
MILIPYPCWLLVTTQVYGTPHSSLQLLCFCRPSPRSLPVAHDEFYRVYQFGRKIFLSQPLKHVSCCQKWAKGLTMCFKKDFFLSTDIGKYSKGEVKKKKPRGYPLKAES